MPSGPRPIHAAGRFEKAVKSPMVRRKRRASSLSFSVISIEPLVLGLSACKEQHLHSRKRAIFCFPSKARSVRAAQFLFFLQRQAHSLARKYRCNHLKKELQLSTVANL